MSRKRSLFGGGRRVRRHRESGWQRFTRGTIEFLLIVVLLLFTASWCGLLEPRHRAPAEPDADDAYGSGTRVVPAVLTESGLGAPGRTGLRGAGLGNRGRLEPGAPAEPSIRVVLANGSGTAKLAASLRGPFRSAGFDICGAINADCSDYPETIVVDRCGDRAKAEAVCAFLRARWGTGRIVFQTRNSLESDVLVVLGRDMSDAAGRGAPDTP
jgi:hypothetical protein